MPSKRIFAMANRVSSITEFNLRRISPRELNREEWAWSVAFLVDPESETTSAEDMVRVTRDAKIIDLRRDGHTYVQIGQAVGVSKSTVFDAIKRWMEANGPSAEKVEELRQFQGAQLDHYQAELAPHLMRTLRNEDGEIIYDGNGDDRKPTQVPDVQVGQMWLRVLERRAKLYGLDMQVGVYVPEITAEMMAALFFDESDPRYMFREESIDVDGEEVDNDREALGLGSGD